MHFTDDIGWAIGDPYCAIKNYGRGHRIANANLLPDSIIPRDVDFSVL